MNTLPSNLVWSIEIAVKKLRPHADFQLEASNFIMWHDTTGSTPPTWEEVMAQCNADQQAAEEWLQNNT
jgi:hypothetical protein